MASLIVLITGANAGVGYAITKVLVQASADFHVIMTGRSIDKVEKAKSEIASSNIKGSLSTFQLEVTSEESIGKAVKHVQDQHGHLDVLINNAGVGNVDPDIRTRFTSTFETNVLGPRLVAEAFRDLQLKSQNPYLVNVSSRGGSMDWIGSSGFKAADNDDAYCMSKAALNMLTVLDARDYGPKGLKVFAFCPGFVVSNIRGTSEEARTGGGRAGDPMVSAETVLKIIRGERDGDVAKLVTMEGVTSW